MEFGERLKALRLKRGWTQEQFGDLADIHPTQISYWEAGKRKPNLESLHKLREAFGCTWNELLGDL